jgi:xylulokinase
MLGGVAYLELDKQAAAVRPGAEGVFVIPHVSGVLLPTPRPEARAALVGFGPHHTPAHLWRAFLESFGYVLMTQSMRLGESIGSVTAAGGGTRTIVWPQVVSDMTGWVQRVSPWAGASRGAALLAYVGLEARSGLEAVTRRWNLDKSLQQIRPGQGLQVFYQNCLRTWEQLDALLSKRDSGSPP